MTTLAATTVTGQTNNVGTSAETAILTTDTVAYNAVGGEGVWINGMLNLLAGTGTTAVVIRVRKGANTTTGTIVGAARTHTLAATNSASVPVSELDTTPGANNVYTVTVQQTGGAAAGNANGTVGTTPVSSVPG